MKPACVFQVDVDSLAIHYKNLGLQPPSQNPGPDPTYALALPRMRNLFASSGIKTTFFIVGKDLENPAHVAELQDIVSEGHELANHSQNHRAQFCALAAEEMRSEIATAQETILEKVGVEVVGFRSPGFEVSARLLDLLRELGYLYDSSLFPTLLGPLLRAMYRRATGNPQNRGYGPLVVMLATRSLYVPSAGSIIRQARRPSLVEVPVGTVPFLRLPFYFNFSLAAGEAITRISQWLCRGSFLNFVFHAIEFLDVDEMPQALKNMPYGRLPLEVRLNRAHNMVEALSGTHQVALTREVVQDFLTRLR